MAYEHDDPRAADPGSGTPHRIDGDAQHGSDLPAERRPQGLSPQGQSPYGLGSGDGPSDVGGLEPDVSASRLDDDLASVLMAGGMLPPVLADVDRDLGFPPQVPDLASAFLAALDAVDDRRFVTPPPPEPEPVREPVHQPVPHESATPPAAPPVITHAAYFDQAHEEQTPAPDPTASETPIAGLLTMGERTEPTKPPLVRIYDAPRVEPAEPPADREAFARDSFDHDLFDHEALDEASDPAAALALDESASGDRVEEQPEPMTVAEWAATFATIEPVASEPGAFEDGAPIDSTIELDAIQDVIPFDDVPAPMHAASPHDARSHEAPSHDAPVQAASAWDEPSAPAFAAKPYEPEPLDDVPFGASPIAPGVPSSFSSTPFDDLTAFERPIGADSESSVHESSAFDAGALESESPFEAEPALDASAFEIPGFEASALEPTVLDDSATFEEPASIDFAVPMEVAEADAAVVEAEPEPDVLEDLQEYVVFSLGELRCVVPIRSVIEVGRIPDAAPVPNSPPWLHGLGNLRGQVLTLIDLKAFFGVGRIKQSTGRMVVLRADADEVTGAVMVDQVHQIVSLSPSRFREAPATLPERSTQFVWGACDYGNYTMIGLDVDGVLGVESMTEAATEAAV